MQIYQYSDADLHSFAFEKAQAVATSWKLSCIAFLQQAKLGKSP